MAHGGTIPEDRRAGNPGEAATRVASALLAGVPGLCHGFSLRAAGSFADPEAARRLTAEVGASRLRLLKQVHGVAVASPDDPAAEPEADAWAGRPPAGVLLGVCTADCLPVLLCHPPSRTVGLAHAGWRGAVAGIVPAVLKAMGVRAEEVWAVLGPSIGPCCYEVGLDVAEAAGPGSAALAPLGGGKFRFDLPGYVRGQLLDAGVPAGRMDRVDLCTGCRTDLLFSYRREGRTGRLCGFLGWLDR